MARFVARYVYPPHAHGFAVIKAPTIVAAREQAQAKYGDDLIEVTLYGVDGESRDASIRNIARVPQWMRDLASRVGARV